MTEIIILQLANNRGIRKKSEWLKNLFYAIETYIYILLSYEYTIYVQL